MNNQSPLLPQGSLVEQKNKGRARVKVAVFFVLAIHGIGLMALLVQGCHHDEGAAQRDATNAVAPTFLATNIVAETNPAAAVGSLPPPPPDTTLVAPPVAGATEYTIAQGDNFTTIGKKFKVSVKALTDANPGIEPTRLKVGQKIHVPAPMASAASTGNGTTATETSNGEQIYVVKSGDNLTKIAEKYGTTPKAIKAANDLTTDRITVGQKLKIPKASATPATTPSAR